MRSVWILHNPRAGKPGYAAQVERAAEALSRRGVSVTFHRSPAIDELRARAREAAAAQADAVLVAGGDGSLGAAGAELAGSGTALGFLPAGTANVWAREMNLPTPGWLRPNALTRAALNLLEGAVHAADLGVVNGRRFLLWAGLGLDAFVMERLEQRRVMARQIGLPYHVAAAFAIAREWGGAGLRVSVDGGVPAAGHYLLAVASNVNWYGGGLFRLSRRARLDDGQLDVWLFAGRTYADALAHTGRLFHGNHERHPQVTRLTGSQFEIAAERAHLIQADGEPLPPTDRLSIQIEPRALRVLVPPQAPRGLFGDER
jgi:diacylglycerol kinase family enzyme